LYFQILEWIVQYGVWGGLIFAGVYVVTTVLFLPGSILTLGGGAIFGLLGGVVWVSLGSTLGATGAFLVGRYIARDWVSKKIKGNVTFMAIDDAVRREGWKIVFLTRLSPILPFNILNYGLGLTQVSLRDYILASWIGMLPGTVMYVYMGSLAGSLADLAAGGRVRSVGEWALYGVGLLATVVVTLLVTKLARKALSQQIA
jgi:uncharacterized membrane protein YdjX (TVP38/TMEM64 family)